eukprot:6192046-Pleurochrysis_carterae.AAC.2
MDSTRCGKTIVYRSSQTRRTKRKQASLALERHDTLCTTSDTSYRFRIVAMEQPYPLLCKQQVLNCQVAAIGKRACWRMLASSHRAPLAPVSHCACAAILLGRSEARSGQ